MLKLVGATSGNLLAGVAGLVAASVIWLPVTRRWSARAHLCWASSTFLFVAYLTFALDWTFASHLGPASTAGGVLLWILEVFAALLSCACLWEICDARAHPARLPQVRGHPSIDDNTDDEDLWRPVEAWCERHNVKFKHLQNWPGYKSGALNYALRDLTSPAPEIVGVVDSDYQVEPGFLRNSVPAFADPWIGFVQANHLSGGQRWAYLAGAIQWYGDLPGLVFLIFLLAGAVNLATGGGELFRKLTVFLVGCVPVLVALGLVRAIALLRRGTGASWRDAASPSATSGSATPTPTPSATSPTPAPPPSTSSTPGGSPPS